MSIFCKRFFVAFLLLCVQAGPAQACVGRILTVGAVDTPIERVVAETIALLINERTGTTVNTKYFATVEQLYSAVRAEEVGILSENTNRALQLLGKTAPAETVQEYNLVKEAFRQEMKLIWQNPFKFTTSADPGRKTTTAVVLSLKVMTDFPGLQRLLNKLADKLDDQAYTQMLERAKSGDKPNRIARDFLEAKKLI